MLDSEPKDERQVIVLDDLAKMMIRHLKEVTAAQPEPPNGGEPGAMAEEMATIHYQWMRERDALRLLLGLELVRLAMKQL